LRESRISSRRVIRDHIHQLSRSRDRDSVDDGFVRGALLILVGGCSFRSPIVGDRGDASAGDDDASMHDGTTSGGCVDQIEARRDFTCAVRTDGTAWCWGRNEYGKLGDGTTTSRPDPVRVAGLSNVVEVALASRQAYALDTGGVVYAWGHNDVGELGDGTTTDRATAAPVPGLSGVIAIRAGRGHVCAVATGGIYCWGWNSEGQLGDGAAGIDRATPYHVGAGIAVATGGRHTCILRSDHSVACTGKNAYGELGDGTTISHDTLANVPGLLAEEIAAGGEQTCARKSDGTVWCWGDDIFGELATGGDANPTPVQVPGVTAAASLIVGGRRTCARRTDGSVWCWGEHPFGTPNSTSNIVIDAPHAVATFDGSHAVSAGAYHMCGTDASGQLLCTGHNAYGQLGDGSTTPRTDFVPVALACE
jgi:alpha-tubulin suppressor-like RCC1 family protein